MQVCYHGPSSTRTTQPPLQPTRTTQQPLQPQTSPTPPAPPSLTPLPPRSQVCYHGPREQVLDFFDSLGFYCPERRGVADFLQEVTTPSDQQVGRACRQGWD